MIITPCWTIEVVGAELDWHTFALQTKDGCYLSGNTKLVGRDKAVALSSRELAQTLCDAVLPTMRRRHGEEVELQIKPGHLPQKGAGFDDDLIMARIAEGNFAPNKRPSGLGLSLGNTKQAPKHYLCTIGTKTCSVILKGNGKPKTGKPITFRLSEPGSTWQKGIVGEISTEGSFPVTLI